MLYNAQQTLVAEMNVTTSWRTCLLPLAFGSYLYIILCSFCLFLWLDFELPEDKTFPCTSRMQGNTWVLLDLRFEGLLVWCLWSVWCLWVSLQEIPMFPKHKIVILWSWSSRGWQSSGYPPLLEVAEVSHNMRQSLTIPTSWLLRVFLWLCMPARLPECPLTYN